MGDVIAIPTERNCAVGAAIAITRQIKAEIAETGSFWYGSPESLEAWSIPVSDMEISTLRHFMKDLATNLRDEDLEFMLKNFWWKILNKQESGA